MLFTPTAEINRRFAALPGFTRIFSSFLSALLLPNSSVTATAAAEAEAVAFADIPGI